MSSTPLFHSINQLACLSIISAMIHFLLSYCSTKNFLLILAALAPAIQCYCAFSEVLSLSLIVLFTFTFTVTFTPRALQKYTELLPCPTRDKSCSFPRSRALSSIAPRSLLLIKHILTLLSHHESTTEYFCILLLLSLLST